MTFRFLECVWHRIQKREEPGRDIETKRIFEAIKQRDMEKTSKTVKITPVEDSEIFAKIKEAMLSHNAGITEVMYDVKNEDVYIAKRASEQEWERDDEGYYIASIFTLQDYESDFEILEMLDCDLEWERNDNREEYEEDNGKFDRKCLEEVIEEIDITDWKIYGLIIESIDLARKDYEKWVENK